MKSVDAAEKVVLDRDDVARAVVRMAHEIVERNARPPESPLAIVGIHRRGVHLASRLHAQVAELLDVAGRARLARHRLLPRRPRPPRARRRSSTPPRSTSRSTARPS